MLCLQVLVDSKQFNEAVADFNTALSLIQATGMQPAALVKQLALAA